VLRVVLFAVPVILAVYATIDCLQTPRGELRGLPRITWIIFILLVPLVGPLVWLFAGSQPRPGRGRGVRPGPAGPRPRPGRPVAPDDDPDFLREIERARRERERRRQREEEQRRRPPDSAAGGDHTPP
jgi:hypothetical protein